MNSTFTEKTIEDQDKKKLHDDKDEISLELLIEKLKHEKNFDSQLLSSLKMKENFLIQQVDDRSQQTIANITNVGCNLHIKLQAPHKE